MSTTCIAEVSGDISMGGNASPTSTYFAEADMYPEVTECIVRLDDEADIADHNVIVGEVIYGESSSRPILYTCDYNDDACILKRMPKSLFTKGLAEFQWRLVHARLMSMPAHPNILKIHKLFECMDCYFIVMEKCTGGELFDFLLKATIVPEDVCQKLSFQILSAVDHLHANGLTHNDIKPENILFRSNCINPKTHMLSLSKCQVVLIDFDTMLPLEDPYLTDRRRLVGTHGYLAPEVYEGAGYSEISDLWSVGSILYMFFTVYPPVPSDQMNSAKQAKSIFRKLKSMGVGVSFDSQIWNNFHEAKDLIQWMLEFNPSLRTPKANVALQHPWFQSTSQARVRAGEMVARIKREQKLKASLEEQTASFIESHCKSQNTVNSSGSTTSPSRVSDQLQSSLVQSLLPSPLNNAFGVSNNFSSISSGGIDNLNDFSSLPRDPSTARPSLSLPPGALTERDLSPLTNAQSQCPPTYYNGSPMSHPPSPHVAEQHMYPIGITNNNNNNNSPKDVYESSVNLNLNQNHTQIENDCKMSTKASEKLEAERQWLSMLQDLFERKMQNNKNKFNHESNDIATTKSGPLPLVGNSQSSAFEQQRLTKSGKCGSRKEDRRQSTVTVDAGSFGRHHRGGQHFDYDEVELRVSDDGSDMVNTTVITVPDTNRNYSTIKHSNSHANTEGVGLDDLHEPIYFIESFDHKNNTYSISSSSSRRSQNHRTSSRSTGTVSFRRADTTKNF